MARWISPEDRLPVPADAIVAGEALFAGTGRLRGTIVLPVILAAQTRARAAHCIRGFLFGRGRGLSYILGGGGNVRDWLTRRFHRGLGRGLWWLEQCGNVFL